MRIRVLRMKRRLLAVLLFLLLSVVGMTKAIAQTGALNGLFTINENGDRVRFSQGNLQYQASTHTWRFAENQWDYVGEDNANISETYDGWIDLFGWGTSGYNHGAEIYQPWDSWCNIYAYSAYGDMQYNLYDQTGQADWGCNPISNGGNVENSGWRTLRQPEWEFVFNERNTTSGIRFAKVIMNGVKGVVLLPDNWLASIYSFSNVNVLESDFESNIISFDDWTSDFVARGAVFLPVTGWRVNDTEMWFLDYGFYWTSTVYTDGDGEAKSVSFGDENWFSDSNDLSFRSVRCEGCAVRLVRPVEPATHGYIDLGLPSGILWATCNVGANSPEEYGDYFAWGETQPKDYFDWSTYQYGDGSTFTKYTGSDGLITLLPEDDAATANWGNGWRMPTREEFEELYDNTTVTWTQQNGVHGRLFTASNGNSLFLPATGYRWVSWLDYAGDRSRYWSSSLHTESPCYAWGFYFLSDNYLMDTYGRYYGFTIRPVRENLSLATVTATANPAEGGTVSGGGAYAEGTTCTLTATPNEGYVFVNWTENGEVVSTEATYSFTVTGNRDLVANFANGDINNLVFNGDFELGNTGFGTDYIYGNTGSYNYYYVGHDIAEMWYWDSPGYIVGDHTSGEGLFMMVDGALEDNTTAWSQTVAVMPNTDYVLSAWFLTNNIGYLRFEINGVSGSDFTTPESSWVWEQQSMTWNSGNSTEATIKIINRFAESGGYDWCVDDIYFGPINSGGSHEYVDLGLPSGILWATCNVGANSPEEYGGYFAWGETTPKDTYNWSTYQYCNGTSVQDPQLTKYCSNSSYGYNGFIDNLTTLLPEDDAATANWGNGWRMPTEEEWLELFDNTTSEWTMQNGVNGRLFTATNGNSLFFPAAGSRFENYPFGPNYYWSSSLDTSGPRSAWHLVFSDDDYGRSNSLRICGLPVRPVRASSQFLSYTINASSNPMEGGEVSGGGTYEEGTTCTLTATPNEGYTFINWTENGEAVSTEATYSFTVTGNRSLVANFVETGSGCSITFNLNDSFGDGWNGNYLVVSYGDISEQLTIEDGSSASYNLEIPDGSHVELTWISGSWIGECSYTISYENGNVIYYGSNMSSGFSYGFDVDCVGMPATIFDIMATADPVNGGTVTGTGEFEYGSTCTLTATANEGYTFMYWTLNGNQVSSASVYSFIVTGDGNLVAHFTLPLNIATSANPAEGGTVSGFGSYDYGATCTLTATSNEGYVFLNWTENGTQVYKNPTYEFTVTRNRTLEANFISIASLLYVLSDDFNDGVINSDYWIASGPDIIEEDGMIKMQQNETDAYVALESVPMRIPSNSQIVIERSFLVHEQLYDSYWGEHYYYGSLNIRFNGSEDNFIGVGYNDDDYENRHGTYLMIKQDGEANETRICDATFDTWLEEKVVVDLSNETLSYYLSDTLVSTLSIEGVSNQQMDYYTIWFNPYGWWTGHQHYMDYVNINMQSSDFYTIQATADPEEGGTVSFGEFYSFEDQQIPSNWTNDTIYPWVITTPEYAGYNGSFCMMSGNAGVHSSTSSIEVTVDFAEDGTISFLAGCWGETGTHSYIYDMCMFYIDGNEQFRKGALQSWNSYSYEVTAGIHTFRWSYSKDFSVHPAGDAFFVDDVCFTGVGDGNPYSFGQTCTLIARPNRGYGFVEWTKNGTQVSTNAAYTFIVTESADFMAHFFQYPTSLSDDFNDGEINPDYWSSFGSRVVEEDGLLKMEQNITDDNVGLLSVPLGVAPNNLIVIERRFIVHKNSNNYLGGYAIEFNGNVDVHGRPVHANSWDGSILNNTGVDYLGIVYGHSSYDDKYGIYLEDGIGSNIHGIRLCNTIFDTWLTEKVVVDLSAGTLSYYLDGALIATVSIPALSSLQVDYYTTIFGPYGWFRGHYHYMDYVNINMDLDATYTVTASASPEEGGTVSGVGTFQSGQTCTLTATANDGYTFMYWTDHHDNIVSYDAVYSFPVALDCDLVAHFALPFTVSASANLFGSGAIVGTGEYDYNTTCTLTASPNDGYLFLNWSKNGEVVSCDDTYSFTVTEDVDLEAVFMLLEGTLVGEGEETNVYLPSYSYYNYTLSQQIYTPDEIGTDGCITSISYYNEGGTKTRNYDIYLVHTDKPTFESETDWITVSEADRVFNGEVTMTRGCWNTILLDIPFDYDGISNLALIVDDNSGNWTSSPHMECRVFNTEVNQAIRVYSDDTNYDPNNPSEYGGTLHSVKNQIILGFSSTCHFITAGNWSTASNWSNGTLPQTVDEVFIDAPCQLDQDAKVAMLTVSGGQSLTLQSGQTLTVTNTLNNTSTLGLIIEDGAQLVHASENVSAMVKKNIAGHGTSNGKYCLISNPLTEAVDPEMSNVYHLIRGSYDLYDWLPNASDRLEWRNFKDNIFMMYPDGFGYLYANRNGVELNFPGILNPSRYRFGKAVSYDSSDNEHPGWNLIGNPFMCNAKLVNANNEPVSYYRMNAAGDGFVADTLGAIAPMEGVFYQASENGTVYFIRADNTSQIPTFTISVSASPSDGGSVSGGTYRQGQIITLRATANNGFTFVNWTENGGVVSTEATYSFSVEADRTLVANFAVSGGDHAYVDLGLPSGLLWATCNVGADTPEGYGDYFAWGETQPKDTYDGSNYQYCMGSYNTLTKYCNNSNYGYNGFTDNLTTLLPEDDAATANWGSDWRVPTQEEWQELLDNTTHTWTTQNGVNGQLFTAANGNSLFLPAAGYRWYDELRYAGSYGDYWSSSLGIPDYAWYFRFLSSNAYMSNYGYRYYGRSVRAVRSASQNTSFLIDAIVSPSEGGTVTGTGNYAEGSTCTLIATANAGYIFINWTENGEVVSVEATYPFTVEADRTLVANFAVSGGDHAYVDLGLPSGLLWATCNVGADTPEGYGDYFAWGETQPKDYYDWSTYQYCMGSSTTLTKYCNEASYGYNGFTDNLTTLLPEDDAATANWGSDWRMPTNEEWQELLDNTTNTWTTQNGVNGRLFTASNGNSLFLPAAGLRYDSILNAAGSWGDYWSSWLGTDSPRDAWSFDFHSGGFSVYHNNVRGLGRSVRPVRSAQN